MVNVILYLISTKPSKVRKNCLSPLNKKKINIVGDYSSKKFMVSDFNNYKMIDSRFVMEQYNETLLILG